MTIGQAGMILTTVTSEALLPQWECQGYTVNVADERWRGVLRSMRPTGDGLVELEIMLSDRTPVRYGDGTLAGHEH